MQVDAWLKPANLQDLVACGLLVRVLDKKVGPFLLITFFPKRKGEHWQAQLK